VLVLQQRSGVEDLALLRMVVLCRMPLESQVVVLRGLQTGCGTGTAAGAGIRVGDGAAARFPAIEHLVAVIVGLVIRGGIETGTTIGYWLRLCCN